MKCKPDTIRLIFYAIILAVTTYFSYYFLNILCTSENSKFCEAKNLMLVCFILGFLTATFPTIFITELISFNFVDIVDDNVYVKKIFRYTKICRLKDIISVKHTNIKGADAYYYKTADNSTFIVMKHMFKNYKEMASILNGNLTVETIMLNANFMVQFIIWTILATINGLLLFGSC